MYGLIAAVMIFGNAPICSFDGFNLSCYYYTWPMCEQAIRGTQYRCVINPNAGR